MGGGESCNPSVLRVCTLGLSFEDPHPVSWCTPALPRCGRLAHVTLNKCFVRDKVTFSFFFTCSSLPSWELGSGLDTEKRVLFLNLPHSSRTLKEQNGMENRNYCLFCFLFKNIKRTLKLWSGRHHMTSSFCHGNILHKRLFSGLVPSGCPSPAAENCCHSWK